MRTAHRTSVSSPLSIAATVAAALSLVAVLAGCTATAAPSTTAGSEASTGTAAQAYDQWELKYRQCVGDKGFELPAGAGEIDFGDRQPAFDAASAVCIKSIGVPPATRNTGTESHTEVQAKMLTIVDCLRNRGYTLDDPKDTVVNIPDNVQHADVEACAAR